MKRIMLRLRRGGRTERIAASGPYEINCSRVSAKTCEGEGTDSSYVEQYRTDILGRHKHYTFFNEEEEAGTEVFQSLINPNY